MEALIYCRVSSKEQAETGYSLEQQEQSCRRYIESSGFKLGRIFIEYGESAKTQKRTELQKMLKYIRSDYDHITFIVVWKLDRLSRDVGDYKSLELLFISLGITIHSATESNEFNAAGKLNRNVIAAFAQFENDIKSERTIAGMKLACEKGRWCWKAPIGYIRVIENKHSIMVIDPDEAIYIQKAFDMAETNVYSKKDIQLELIKMGLSDLKKDKLTKMLSNVLYIGKIKVSWFPDLIDAEHEPIITVEQFTKVQDVLLSKRKGGINRSLDNPDFPLNKVVKCSLCGERITGSKSTGGSGIKYAYYHCSSKKKCSVRTPKLELEEKFYILLNEMTLKDNALKATLASIMSEIDGQKKKKKGLIKSIKTKIQIEKNRKDRLLELLLDRTISEDDAKDKMRKIDDKLLSFESQLEINRLENIDAQILLKSFKHFISNFGDLWLNTIDVKLKERIQSIIFPEKVYWDGKEFRTGKTPLFMRISGDLNTKKRDWYPRADSNG